MNKMWSKISAIEWICYFLCVLFVLLSIVLIYLIIKPPKITEGVVIKKHYTPAHVQFQTMIINKAPITQTLYHPESFNIVIKKEKVKEHFSVHKEFYDSISVGDYIKMKNRHVGIKVK
jgi:hypothetical protein